MRAVSAKALYILLLYMLLPFAFPFSRRPLVQGDHHLHEITQGAAALYPGLCAFALTARLNEGFYQAKLCVGSCKALRWRLQCFASEVAKLALKSSVLFWIIEKGGQTQHTGHCSPQKNLQNRQMARNEFMQEQKNRVSHALRCGLPWLMIGVVRQ